ncbi:MAG: hypothetical protein KGM16_03310 [Bacteroidota bacterium]|nr:hypothetical protein [Bacteroidota bacterium]
MNLRRKKRESEKITVIRNLISSVDFDNKSNAENATKQAGIIGGVSPVAK